jgi:hypothetical protein
MRARGVERLELFYSMFSRPNGEQQCTAHHVRYPHLLKVLSGRILLGLCRKWWMGRRVDELIWVPVLLLREWGITESRFESGWACQKKNQKTENEKKNLRFDRCMRTRGVEPQQPLQFSCQPLMKCSGAPRTTSAFLSQLLNLLIGGFYWRD